MKIIIKTAGFVPDTLTITQARSSCGDIKDGIGCHFGTTSGGVLSFEDFEAAYFHLKKLREQPPDEDEGGDTQYEGAYDTEGS